MKKSVLYFLFLIIVLVISCNNVSARSCTYNFPNNLSIRYDTAGRTITYYYKGDKIEGSTNSSVYGNDAASFSANEGTRTAIFNSAENGTCIDIYNRHLTRENLSCFNENCFTYSQNESNNSTAISGIYNLAYENETYEQAGVFNDFCDVDENPGVMRAFKMGGIVIYILKIVIPLLLIVMGSVDIFQAVISSDDKQLNKSIGLFVKRIIAGVAIFFIPTIVNYLFSLVDSEATTEYKTCYNCLLDVSTCPEIPKVGE